MKNLIIKKRLIREVGLKSFFLLFMLLFILSCNPFKPEPELEPGRRNYTWEIDTLQMPINYITAIWGASPSELWAVGGGGTDNDRLMHFDGSSWLSYSKETIYCAGEALFGFSADNIWMGGGVGYPESGGGLWHYDGQAWSQYYLYAPDDSFYTISVRDIWGPKPNNVYACGIISYPKDGVECWRGFVLHFDGEGWREIVKADFNSQFLRLSMEDENVYAFSYGINYETGDGDVEFYRVYEDSLEQIFSGKESEISWANLSSIDQKVYFVINQDVYHFEDNTFAKVLSIDNPKFYSSVFGRHKKDLFFVMSNGIVHYNGIDTEYIYNKPSYKLRFMGNPLIIENHIYHCMRCDGFYDYILHGQLIEE